MAVAASLVFAGLSTSAVYAQSEADFVKAFSGEWRVFDSLFSAEGQPCRLALGTDSEQGRYKVETGPCQAELSKISHWRIADGQMALLEGDKVIVTLGGNQRRMSGTSAAGNPVILERAGAGSMASLLQAARKATGCYYLGFTKECAPEAELAKPVAGGGSLSPSINVVVKLNVRAEARDDANVLGAIPANSCIVADTCVTASDGVWCRAKFGDRTGWLRKLALRQNRWPVVTFTNGCVPKSTE